MNNLQIFNSPEFGQVRTIQQNGEPWFVGKDVAEILGYKDTSDAMKKHVDIEDKLTRRFADSGQNREMYIINESGLYSLILSSKMPKAKEFKRWVTSEVIPAIRKTGGYIAGSENMTDAEIMAKAVLVAQSTIRQRDQRIKE
ncbi:BRO-N domain-containing protein, partial [Phascolarctobacterium succinatutens]